MNLPTRKPEHPQHLQVLQQGEPDPPGGCTFYFVVSGQVRAPQDPSAKAMLFDLRGARGTRQAARGTRHAARGKLHAASGKQRRICGGGDLLSGRVALNSIQ